MNRPHFVRELARIADISEPRALELTNAMIEIIKKTLQQRESIRFVGFGSFQIIMTPEKKARNIRKNEAVLIPERYRLVFRPSPKLLGTLNENNVE